MPSSPLPLLFLAKAQRRGDDQTLDLFAAPRPSTPAAPASLPNSHLQVRTITRKDGVTQTYHVAPEEAPAARPTLALDAQPAQAGAQRQTRQEAIGAVLGATHGWRMDHNSLYKRYEQVLASGPWGDNGRVMRIKLEAAKAKLQFGAEAHEVALNASASPEQNADLINAKAEAIVSARRQAEGLDAQGRKLPSKPPVVPPPTVAPMVQKPVQEQAAKPAEDKHGHALISRSLLGREVLFALPREASALKPSRAALRIAADKLGISVSEAEKSLTAYTNPDSVTDPGKLVPQPAGLLVLTEGDRDRQANSQRTAELDDREDALDAALRQPHGDKGQAFIAQIESAKRPPAPVWSGEGAENMRAEVVPGSGSGFAYHAVLIDGDSGQTVVVKMYQDREQAIAQAKQWLHGDKAETAEIQPKQGEKPKPSANDFGNLDSLKANLASRPAKPKTPPTEYRYALVNRPAGIGTVPKEGRVRVDPRPEKGQAHYDLARHGFAVYSRPLTDEEIYQFELTPMVSVDEHAQRIIAKMGRYASRYAEPANAEYLDEYLDQQAGRVGVASTEDRTALKQCVLEILQGKQDEKPPAGNDQIPATEAEAMAAIEEAKREREGQAETDAPRPSVVPASDQATLAEHKSLSPFEAIYPHYVNARTLIPANPVALPAGHQLVDVGFHRLQTPLSQRAQARQGVSPQADFYRYGVARNAAGALYSFTEYPQHVSAGDQGAMRLHFAPMRDDQRDGAREFDGLNAAARAMYARHAEAEQAGQGEMFKAVNRHLTGHMGDLLAPPLETATVMIPTYTKDDGTVVHAHPAKVHRKPKVVAVTRQDAALRAAAKHLTEDSQQADIPKDHRPEDAKLAAKLKPEGKTPAEKDQALRTAIAHLEQDRQAGRVPKHEKQEDGELLDQLKAAVAPKTATPASAADDLDPASPNYRYRDTGYVAGSRKEAAAAQIRDWAKRGARVRSTQIDWAALEANPREAKALISKSNLFGQVDWPALREQGMEPAAGFLVDRIYAAIAQSPSSDAPQARQDYALGLQTLRDRLEACRTVKQVTGVLQELHDEYEGVILNEAETAEYARLTEASVAISRVKGALREQVNLAQQRANATNSALWPVQRKIDQRKNRGWAPDPALAERYAALAQERDAAWQVFHELIKQVQPKIDAAEAAWSELYQQREAINQGAARRNKLGNPLHRAWLTMGERFMRVLRYRRYKGSDAFKDQVAEALAGQPADWSWAEASGARMTPTLRKEQVRFQLKVADTHERIGGRQVQPDSTADLKTAFGLREVQSGNWVLADPVAARFHVEQTAGALADLADLLGVPDTDIALHGRVAMAFGARGRGNAGWRGAARAHYEPIERVINLTKLGGGGCLGHELFHALDNLLPEAVTGQAVNQDAYVTANPALLPPGALREAVDGLRQAMLDGEARAARPVKYTARDVLLARHNLGGSRVSAVRRLILDAGNVHAAVQAIDDHFLGRGQPSPQLKKRALEWRRIAVAWYGNDEQGGELLVKAGPTMSRFAAEAVDLDGGGRDYYALPQELAARAFQAWIEDRLAAQGRRNDYLSWGADNRHYFDPMTGVQWRPFPEGEERVRINAALDRLVAVMRHEGALAKAFSLPPGNSDSEGNLMWLSVLSKAHVPAHTRTLASGKVVQVRAYNDRRPRRMSQARHDARTGDLFADLLPAVPATTSPAIPAPATTAPAARESSSGRVPVVDLTPEETRTLARTATYRRQPTPMGSDADRQVMAARYERSLALAGLTEPPNLHILNEDGPHYGITLTATAHHALQTNKQALDHALSTLRSVGDVSGHYAYPVYESEAYHLRRQGYAVFHADGGWWIDAVPVLRAARRQAQRSARVPADTLHTLALIDRRTPEVWEFPQPLPDTAAEYPLQKALPRVLGVTVMRMAA